MARSCLLSAYYGAGRRDVLEIGVDVLRARQGHGLLGCSKQAIVASTHRLKEILVKNSRVSL
ncbi:hypothetical protein [Dictyobacter halimunensis]|uniref:hypothetical protein n=1 Tax=Dictyobacter halimunensis TaxID=3026934 RepID=UPI0030C75E03